MTPEQLKQELNKDQPEHTWPTLLKALWWDARGDWDRAHTIARNVPTPDGAWVHAYLHREEGDLWNADYWYDRADRERPSVTLEQEWNDLVRYFDKILDEK